MHNWLDHEKKYVSLKFTDAGRPSEQKAIQFNGQKNNFSPASLAAATTST